MKGIIGNIAFPPNGKAENIDIKMIKKPADYAKKERQSNVLFIIIVMKISVPIAYQDKD